MRKGIGKTIAAFFALAINASAAEINFANFANPAPQYSPWIYWFWVNGNVDKRSITEDIETIKGMGIGGILMFDNRGYWEDDNHLLYPKPANTNLDSQWLENLTHAVGECRKSGLKMSINLSDCGGNLKGPHKTLSDAPKKIVFKTLPVAKTFDTKLPVPPERFSKPIATFAIKYDGDKIEKESEWFVGGDGLYTMAATSGKRLDKAPEKIRNALEVIDLTDRAKDGSLRWSAPDDGNWAILQLCYATMDDRPHDVDILDPNAIRRHYERWAGSFRKCFGGEFGKTIERFYNVSWEGSIPTWTNNFEEFFRRDRGYDIRPWLPYLAGFVVKNKEQCLRFMTDFRRARNNCMLKNFYAKMGDLAHKDGLMWHSESGGPWKRSPQTFGEADQLAFLGVNDMPQGEFWVDFPDDEPRQYGRYLVHPIASAAHIYGKDLVAMEAFTHMTYHWSMYPAHLKFYADRAFIQGMNFAILHSFTASPKKFGVPGIEYFAGSHFNQNTTWNSQSPEFIKYIARCQFLLRYGKPQADFCLYEGDVPYESWYGTDYFNCRFAKFKNKRAYDFAPLKFDTVNNDVLLDGAKVVDKKLVLKSGMTYAAMYVDIPSASVSPKALAKILEFKKHGLPVFCSSAPKPNTSAGLGESDADVAKLADEIWDGGDFGKFAKTLTPSCEGDFEYIFRRGENDVYFLAGEGEGTAVFNSDGVPELWDAVDGKKYAPDFWNRLPDGRAKVKITLPKNGSIFVVFVKKSSAAKRRQIPANAFELNGAWKVEFPRGLGAPESITLDELADLSAHENFGVRHFSGTATYKKTFKLDTLPKRALLDLGKVHNVAEVYLNGKKSATLWSYPFVCDVSKFLKDGENSLEIKVVNTWQNRLIGDCKVPEEQRIARSNVRTRPTERGRSSIYSGFAKDDKLPHSGLIGKVVLRCE